MTDRHPTFAAPAIDLDERTGGDAEARHMISSCRAIIFDMDGTLTRPVLDFDALAARIGIDEGPILEAMQRMDDAARRRAESILQEVEADAAARSELQPGAMEVVQALRDARIPTALMTRNSRCSVETFLDRHGLRFDAVRTREDGVVKPSPEPVHQLCRTLGVPAGQTWVIGDYRFDIDCAIAAGATAVLLLNDAGTPDWARTAHVVIRDLRELLVPLGLAAATPRCGAEA
ncbi:MAG: HAD family hydrolase [Phycisphaerae bacterium]|nr:HAD family hydrolase [Phycisphaerae bacterium]